MKIISFYKQHLFNKRNQAEVTFVVKDFQHIRQLDTLDENKQYTMEIRAVKSKRSLEQNRLLWKLLHELEKYTYEPAMDWYIKALTETGAKVDYVWGTEATEDTLKKTFRAVQRVKPHKIKDTDGWLYRVIMGSSKFNVEQMTQLIETVMRYCEELFIDIGGIAD